MTFYNITFVDRIERGDFTGVSLNHWGDEVVFADDISEADVKAFAAAAFNIAYSAQNTVVGARTTS